MNTRELGKRPCFINPVLYRMKALQKLKNNLLETLAGYVAQTLDKTDTLAALSTIQESTCEVITKTVNGDIIPGTTVTNNQCDC
jgi:hypothetical protein